MKSHKYVKKGKKHLSKRKHQHKKRVMKGGATDADFAAFGRVFVETLKTSAKTNFIVNLIAALHANGIDNQLISIAISLAKMLINLGIFSAGVASSIGTATMNTASNTTSIVALAMNAVGIQNIAVAALGATISSAYTIGRIEDQETNLANFIARIAKGLYTMSTGICQSMVVGAIRDTATAVQELSGACFSWISDIYTRNVSMNISNRELNDLETWSQNTLQPFENQINQMPFDNDDNSTIASSNSGSQLELEMETPIQENQIETRDEIGNSQNDYSDLFSGTGTEVASQSSTETSLRTMETAIDGLNVGPLQRLIEQLKSNSIQIESGSESTDGLTSIIGVKRKVGSPTKGGKKTNKRRINRKRRTSVKKHRQQKKR